jgi:biuret amidohydrolase
LPSIVDTNPYPWPYDGCLDPRRMALVICGAQRGLAELCPTAGDVLRSLAVLASRCRAMGTTVVFVRHGAVTTQRSSTLPRHGSPAWELALSPDGSDVVVDAMGWDGTYASPLDHVLRTGGRDHVVLGGLASELTVDSTVRTLNDRGHECLVLIDGCAPVDAALGARAHASLTMSGGIFGALGTISNVNESLLGDSPHALTVEAI